MKLVIRLEEGVWLASGDGDPPRTLQKENAKVFNSTANAKKALHAAREFRMFWHALFEVI